VFVSGRATILHADLDSFYASVEQRDDPRLRGRPVLVGSGIVLAASYEAKAYGVRTPMNCRQARRLCPGAVVVDPRMSAYAEASTAVFDVFERTTPLVEGLSIDEAFLDVGGLGRVSGTPTEIARQLRRDVLEQVGLPITVGVARTKFLAKVASGVAKPDGLLVVPPDGELAFLHPLPVERLWGVGPVTAHKLHERAITTVGQVARLSEDAVVAWLGQASGRHLYALAHNRDPRPVQVGRRRKSVGAQRALGRSPKTADAVDAALVELVDRVTRRMRDADRAGRTITLRLRFDDFTRATRSPDGPHPHDPRRRPRPDGGGSADDRRERPDARGHRRRQSGRRRDPAPALVRPHEWQRTRHRAGRRAPPLRLGGHHARRPARPRAGNLGPSAPRLSTQPSGTQASSNSP